MLPILIASDINGISNNLRKIFAVVTAMCVAVLNWGNIGIAAGTFDKAATILQNTSAIYPNDQPKLGAAFKEANDLLTGLGPTLLPSITKPSTKE